MNRRRCQDHLLVPPLNREAGDERECAVCLAGEVGDRLAVTVLFPVLDGYAERLAHHAELRARLREARARLDFLSPGAGDFLAGDCED